jgi:hypothetical protein
MRAMPPKLICIPLARDADHKPEIPVRTGLHSREGVLDDNGAHGFNPEQFCRHQVSIRSWFAGQVFGMDNIAIDLYVEEMIQLGRL